ncbi:MAG: fibronectin type III domain-containing protein, partial [Oscillospiraceae bacterium]|nr:fibronectin type III domain-containing protein [Oscillospiraceae bacterium]
YPSVIKSVTPSQAPQPPANIIAKGYENSGVISWDPVLRDDGSGNYADGYYVTIYKVGVSAPLSNHTHVRSPEPTYTADKLENDVEYYAEISAYVIVNGSEIEGPTARSNTFTPTITVDNVLNLTATPSGKTLVISWTAVKGASEYVLIRTDPDGSQREIYKGNKTSFTDSFVDNNTEYLYKVMAIRKVDGKDYLSDYSSEQRGIINYALGSVQGLTATGGDGCIILKWDKVTGADGYYVQYSVPDAGSWTTIANVGTNTYTHTGLVNGTVYDYRIIPYVIINNKEEANDIYAQKMQGKAGINLPAPANFTVTAGDGMITLSWTAVKGAEGYNVYLVGYDGTTYLLDQVTKTTAIHTNLSNNTTFTYTVRAFKYVDGTMVEGDYSIYKTATAGIELNAPTDVAAKAGKEQVSLSWKKSNGAEGYVVYAYNISTLSFTPVGIVTKTSFVHTGLVAGREYTYMIAAYKNVNGSVVYSGYSMAVTAIPESSGTTPSGDNSNTEAGDYRIFITGTTPYGMSNSDLISAFAGKGAFNSDIDVRFTLSPDTVTSVQNVLNFYGEGIDSFLIYPMDISIYVAGTNTRATINEGQYLTLTIPVPDELLPYSDHISVVHVSDLNQLEILPSIHVNVGGVDCMQFTANSFSPYAFVVYLPEIGEDTGAGTPVTAQGTSGSGTSGQSAVFSFRNTYLPAIYRRRARNKLYRMVRR